MENKIELEKDLTEIFDDEYEKRHLITPTNTAKKLTEKGYTKQEWISVEDRLPDEDERVLVALTRSRSYTIIDTDRISNKYSYKWVRWGNDVTHWMPLPPKPKMKGAE